MMANAAADLRRGIAVWFIGWLTYLRLRSAEQRLAWDPTKCTPT
jgi:hypothetical protein